VLKLQSSEKPFSDLKQKNKSLTGNLGVAYMPSSDLRMTLNYSTGFRSPNFDDMTKVFESVSGQRLIVPNVNLKPEITQNFEAGFQYNDGKLDWKKPVSCHLFPILVRKSKRDPDVEYVNYQPREDLCKSGCKLGKKLKVPVYVFLKDALIRKYGEEFYNTLSATAEQINKK
jgi:hypothetical protein